MKKSTDKTKLIEIIGQREKCLEGTYKGYTQTVFYKDNKVFAIFPPYVKQPRYGQKIITINCWEWAVKWNRALKTQ